MRLLLKSAFLNKKHYFLLIVTVFAMFFMTLASQIEILSLGVMAKADASLFLVFGEKKGEKLEAKNDLTLEEIKKKWPEVAGDQEALTPIAVQSFLKKNHSLSLIQRMTLFLDETFHIYTHLLYLGILLVTVACFKAISLFAYRYFTKVISIRVSRDLRLRYFAHIQKLPMSFYQSYDIGSLSSRVTGDSGIVAEAINAMLMNYIQMPFAICTTLVACFAISYQLSLLIFFGFPLLVFPIIYLAKRIKKLAKEMQRNQESFASVLIDFLAGIMTIKIFAMEDFSYKKYRQENDQMAKLQERNARLSVSSRPILHTVSSLFFALIIIAGLYFFHLSPAEILVFCGLLYILYEPIKKFAEENHQIFQGIAAAERMYEVLDINPTVIDREDAKVLEDFSHSLEFSNVSFKYGENWILKNLSFIAKKGEMVAIVGPTGAGKSTIAHLIPRLYDVQEGSILIDGNELQTYTTRSLRDKIGFVSQKPIFFIDSIKENIAFGRNFSQEEIEQAAIQAYAAEFIDALPKKYDFAVAESGKNLSGGQQQRLAIARALIKKAPILVMDEATSALDAESEQKIKDALKELKKQNVTQIIIAHRLSTIAHADKIIFLKKGKKIAEGSKDQLLQNCPDFRRMWEMMMQSEESSKSERNLKTQSSP